MSRSLQTLSLLFAVAFSAAPLLAGELSVAIGIRQTFPAGDVNGDLAINQDDIDIIDEQIGESGVNFASDVNSDGEVDALDENTIVGGFGATVSGVIGSDGGTIGPTNTLGGQTLVADGTWQLMTFTLPLDHFSPHSDWGVLESLRFTNTTDGQTRYQVWIDDVASVNSSGATVFTDFEGFSPGQTGVLFHQPRFSGETVGDLLTDPDTTEVTDQMAFSGDQSLAIEWEFVDDDPSRQLQLSSMDTADLPNPLIQLRDGDYSQVLVDGTVSFSQTSVTFWAKAVVVPEPSGLLLMLAASTSFLCRQMTS